MKTILLWQNSIWNIIKPKYLLYSKYSMKHLMALTMEIFNIQINL